MEDEYEQFIQTHQNQLVDNHIPKHFYRRLYEKMKNEIFDSGAYFQICPVDDDDEELVKPFNPERAFYVSTIDDVILDPENDENAIFLIDHAWTYRIKDAKNDLKAIPNLYERMTALMKVNSDNKDDGIELILQRMWKFNQTRAQIEGQQSYWYVMDELGSAIRHSSSNANVCCVPFFFEPSQTMFTLLYPIVRIEQPFTEIFRNYVYDNTNPLNRNIRLLPWQRVNFRKIALRSLAIENCPEIFQQKTNPENFLPSQEPRKIDQDQILKVYTDQNLVKEHLTDPHYQFIDQSEQADIIFPRQPIINKELLSLIARRWKSLYGSSSLETDPYRNAYGIPPWLPMTFNLTSELPQLAVYFQYREDQQIDNTWIIKPVNVEHSMDESITNLLDMILRLPESGAKIACKYISTPVLFDGIKFDMRYFVLLRSIQPFKLYVYKKFQVRLASKPFSMKELDDYETHFTSINEIDCQIFINKYGGNWSTIEKSIFQMFRELFSCAISEEPSMGIGSYLPSRAVYAVDVMLEMNDKNDIQPKLLKINSTFDCYWENFYNQVFNLLFHDLTDEQNAIDISI